MRSDDDPAPARSGTPLLVVVSGRPGSGKSTLARAVASTLGWPLVGRDEIFNALAGGPLDGAERWEQVARTAYDAFFDTLALLAIRGVPVVADAAFQHARWSDGLSRLPPVELRLLRCDAPSEVRAERLAERFRGGVDRPCHHPPPGRAPAGPTTPFTPVTLPSPTLDVDTGDDPSPTVGEIVAWLSAATPSPSARRP